MGVGGDRIVVAADLTKIMWQDNVRKRQLSMRINSVGKRGRIWIL